MNHAPDSTEKAFHFMATGIGSVPFTDVQETCVRILGHLPHMPFWPQFPRRSYLEDMTIQFTEGLSLVKVDPSEKRAAFTDADAADALTVLYEHVLSEDLAHFAMSRDCAPGLYEMIALVRGKAPGSGLYIKGHTTGPVTLAMAIRDHEGKALIHSPEWTEALSRALAAKALWQVRELAGSGRKPILFVDEPSLTGFGSAFSPIQRHEVVEVLGEFMRFLRERSPVLLGIHCCGNTDWSMLLEAGPDIINFDAFGYMEAFLLYRDEITRFIRQGGTIAWGIVPTSGDEVDRVSAEHLCQRLRQGLTRLYGWGLDAQAVSRQSLLTPACGMGNLPEASASRVLSLVSDMSRVFSRGT